ncbi:hypothetical protein SS53G_2065 [Shigella sonnei 53G]|nr:hypothetical protein SS53G_2065 [Shigella sonnei 53G]
MPFYFRKECPLNSGYLTEVICSPQNNTGAPMKKGISAQSLFTG